jgi:uncharacterized protein
LIAVDTNLLVYSHRREMQRHDSARSLMGRLAEGAAPWAIPWPCLAEFFAAVTHTKLWKGRQSSPTQALAQMRAWLDSPRLTLLAETRETFEILEELVTRSSLCGPSIHDARIAAICITHGVEELLTADRDFSRFPLLRHRNPFA